MNPDKEITLVEVGPRDGLQYEKTFFPTEKKIELINLLSRSGLAKIEVSSFIHPKVIPQFTDVIEVINGIERREGVVYSALVPNVKGCQRALELPVDELALFVSASEQHNKKNVNMTVDQSLSALAEVAAIGLKAGRSLRGYVVTAFGCPYQGRIPIGQVLKVIAAYVAMGVKEVSLGDTTGMANPGQVDQTVKAVRATFPALAVAVHFHNSRGTGLVNAVAAYQAGIRIFDSSVGGIGGCPTAMGALGNIATEDFVNLMEEMGVHTGVDFDTLLHASSLAETVIGTELPSYTLKAKRPNWNGTA
jgi:hydroxymethylglutaryl-CoA lyase